MVRDDNFVTGVNHRSKVFAFDQYQKQHSYKISSRKKLLETSAKTERESKENRPDRNSALDSGLDIHVYKKMKSAT